MTRGCDMEITWRRSRRGYYDGYFNRVHGEKSWRGHGSDLEVAWRHSHCCDF